MKEKINIDTNLGDFVAMYPKTRKVFEKLGFDYCCGGKQDIKSAAKEKKVKLKDLIFELENAINKTSEKNEEKIWINEPLTDVVNHILSTHHTFMHKELPYISKLINKVTVAHAEKHGDFLNWLNSLYQTFKDNLEEHLNIEETILFPYIKELEASQKNIKPDKETKKFKKIVDILSAEHDVTGDTLCDMRELTSDYVLPLDACKSFEELYEHLQAVEEDLHKHIHLENTVLFPRLVVLINS